jgi:hypothetical protein
MSITVRTPRILYWSGVFVTKIISENTSANTSIIRSINLWDDISAIALFDLKRELFPPANIIPAACIQSPQD